MEYEDRVYLEKTCEEHGFFKTLIWEGKDYERWSDVEKFKTPQVVSSDVDKGCPYDCVFVVSIDRKLVVYYFK